METSDILSTIAIILSTLSCCTSILLTIIGLAIRFIPVQELLASNIKISSVDRTYSTKEKPPRLRLKVLNLGQRPALDLKLEVQVPGTGQEITARSIDTLKLEDSHIWDIGVDVFEHLKSSGVLKFAPEGLFIESPRDIGFDVVLSSRIKAGFIPRSITKRYHFDMRWQGDSASSWAIALTET